MAAELTDLVDKAKAGDQRAFEEIVQLTYRDAYTLARRLTGSNEDAADVVQEAYIKAYRNIGSFRGDAAFSTWMYRITANCASTYLSRHSNRKHESLAEDEELVDTRTDTDPEVRADNMIDAQILAQALDILPETLRQVVVLYDIYDMSHEQIAKELGINEATAKVRLHRARKKLRERLFPDKGEDKRHAV